HSLRLTIYISRMCIFFFNDTPTPALYTLSLHDALPISDAGRGHGGVPPPLLPRAEAVLARRARRDDPDAGRGDRARRGAGRARGDRKSTRLNSSHRTISYAVFCLKKKKKVTKALVHAPN